MGPLCTCEELKLLVDLVGPIHDQQLVMSVLEVQQIYSAHNIYRPLTYKLVNRVKIENRGINNVQFKRPVTVGFIVRVSDLSFSLSGNSLILHSNPTEKSYMLITQRSN